MPNLLEILAVSLLPLAMAGVWVVLIPFAIVYILERSRAQKQGTDTNGLGAATVAGVTLTIGWQTLLAGVALLIAHILEDFGQSAQDTAIGMIVGAVVASVVPAMLMRHAVLQGGPRLARGTFGVNAIVGGLLASGTTIALMVAWLNDADKIGAMLAVTIVYTLGAVAAARPLLKWTPEPVKDSPAPA